MEAVVETVVEVSELSLSDAVAFRVDFGGPLPPPAQRDWRGPVLSRFDGRVWSALPRPGTGTLTPWRAGGIAYSVTLEPHGKPWLFALDLPASLPRPAVDDAAAAAGYAMLTRDQQLIARAPVAQVIRYEQLSMLRDAFPPFDDDDGRDALRLPSRSNPRTVAFAQELRARHADDRALVAAALAWFRDEPFVYTLRPPALGEDEEDRRRHGVEQNDHQHLRPRPRVLVLVRLPRQHGRRGHQRVHPGYLGCQRRG